MFNALLSIAFFFMIRSCYKNMDECQRLEQNQNTLMSDIVRYKTKSGEDAVSVAALTLRNDELEQYKSIQAHKIKELELKLKRIDSYTRTVTQTVIEIKTVIDTVRILDRDKTYTFSWRDDWCDVKGYIADDTVTCNVVSRDTLHQVIHRIPRRFWFIRYGTKGFRQEIVSSNPHTRITYAEYIKLK